MRTAPGDDIMHAEEGEWRPSEAKEGTAPGGLAPGATCPVSVNPQQGAQGCWDSRGLAGRVRLGGKGVFRDRGGVLVHLGHMM